MYFINAAATNTDGSAFLHICTGKLQVLWSFQNSGDIKPMD